MRPQTWMVLALVVPLALATVAGTASAQGTNKQNTFQINCPGGPSQIQPLGAPGQWSCTIDPTFGGGVSDPINPQTIVLASPDAPSWANVIISPTAVSFTYDAQQQGAPAAQFQISVALNPDAPAFETTRITIRGTPTNPNPAEAVTVLETQIPVTPGYFNLYNVRVDQKIGRAGPQDAVDYPIVVDNFSNGQTRFEFALVAEELPGDFQAVVPEPLVLESRASGGKTVSNQVNFQVYTPYRNGYVNDIGAIQLRVDSFYAVDTNVRGASSTVSTLTQARGFYVPGFEAPLIVLGLLGAAVGAARFRRDDL